MTESLTPAALSYLCQPEGQKLLVMASEWINDPLRGQLAMRAHFPAHWCRAALSLAQLRQRGRAKFSQADRMYFDREGLEMASGEVLATYRAQRLAAAGEIADLCCGIGGDLMQLGVRATVRAYDLNRTRLHMARLNAEVAGIDRLTLVQADVEQIKIRGDAVFIDPARRQAGRRTRRGSAYAPPLGYLEVLRRAVPNVVAKIAPAIDESELPTDGEVEFVSFGGQCREGVLYFGSLATTGRRATLLPEGHTLVATKQPAIPCALPGAYVYDPDPAVVRSHLIDELGHHIGAWKLDPHIAYLSSDQPVLTPFARTYQVLDMQPFNLKRLRQMLKAEGFYPTEIKKRRFAIEPEQLRQRLKIRDGSRPITLILTRLDRGPTALICQRITE